MPKLSCPKCDLSVRVADDRLGRPVYCSACGGCLWMPPAPPPPPAPDWTPAAEPPPVRPPPKPAPAAAEPEWEPDRPAVGCGGVALLCFALVALAVAFTVVLLLLIRHPAAPGRPPPGPESPAVRPEREGAAWDVERLLRYLEGRGVAFTVGARPSDAEGVWLSARDGAAVQSVMVRRLPDADAARRAADAEQSPPAVAWGCFVISGPDSELFRQIVACLPQRD